MKISSIIFVVLSISIRLNAQINSQFIHHLVLADQHKEHLTYLNSIDSSYGLSDSLTYYRVKYHLLLKDYGSFQNEIKNCTLCFQDSSLLNYSATKLFKHSIRATEQLWKLDSIRGIGISRRSLLKKSFDLIQNPNISKEFLPYELEVHFNEYAFVNKKKAWIAGSLSTAIPGLGKLYIGRPNSFVGSFISNVFYGITAFESINKLGIQNAYSLISTGAFGVFYLSNIIGVVHDLKRIKNEKKKHFLYEVATYQSAGIYLYE